MEILDWSYMIWERWATPSFLKSIGWQDVVPTNLAKFTNDPRFANLIEAKKLSFVGNVQAQMDVVADDLKIDRTTITKELAKHAVAGDRTILQWLGDQAIGRPGSEVRVFLDNAMVLSIVAQNYERRHGIAETKTFMEDVKQMAELAAGKE